MYEHENKKLCNDIMTYGSLTILNFCMHNPYEKYELDILDF